MAANMWMTDHGLGSDMPKPFDKSASGFIGGDGVVAMVLQCHETAKRVHAIIVNTETQVSRPDETGLCYPSLQSQQQFLSDFYVSLDEDVHDEVEYVEAHGLGIPDVDRDEVGALARVLCQDRAEQLQIGSVKASTGHTLSVSVLVSIAKILVAMESGMIPANTEFAENNPKISPLRDGRVKVVKENTRMHHGYCAVNSLGMGGYHSHTLLLANEKTRALHYMASHSARLCVYQGVTEEGLHKLLQFMCNHCDDFELHSLLNETSQLELTSGQSGQYPYRGYCVLNSGAPEVHVKCFSAPLHHPLWLVFSGVGSMSPALGRSLLGLDLFHQSVLESGEVLKQYDFNLHCLLTEGGDNAFEVILNRQVALTVIQIGFVSLLREMEIVVDGLLGLGSGQLACCYMDGSLTAREAILAAYWWGHALENCKNKDLKAAAEAFRRNMKGIIQPKSFSKCWVHTSQSKAESCTIDYLVEIMSCEAKREQAKEVPSHDEHQLEAFKQVPRHAIVIEVATGQGTSKKIQELLDNQVTAVSLMEKGSDDEVENFFESLGQCYLAGLQFNPLGIFPPMEYPVSRGVPLLSPFFTWDHAHSWDVPHQEDFLTGGHGQFSQTSFQIATDGKYSHLLDHVISGRPVFPLAGHILLAWKCLARYHGELFEQMAVQLEGVQVHRPVILPDNGALLSMHVRVIPLVGEFEITEGQELVCSGRITRLGKSLPDTCLDAPPTSPLRKLEIHLTQEEVYRELCLMGHNYSGKFQVVTQADNNGESGQVTWTGDWLTFMTGMIQLSLLGEPVHRSPHITRLGQVSINPAVHRDGVESGVALVHVNRGCNSVTSGGVKLEGVVTVVEPVCVEPAIDCKDFKAVHVTKSAYLAIPRKASNPRWVSSLLTYPSYLGNSEDHVLCYPRFCTIGENDVAIVRGGWGRNMNPKGRGLVDWEGQGLGKMFSGYDNSGKRVMGFVPTGAMATKVYAEKVHQWRVLDSWSLQEASTVPLPYFQAYHALVQRAGIDKNKSVLVVGSGAEGRAGVAVAMQYACSVYVAAETDKHKIMLLEDFQDLKDWTFLKQDMHGEVLRRTNGQGVDIVFHCGEPGSLQTVCPLVRDGGSLMQCHTTGNVPADEGQGTVLISLLQRNCRLCHISIDRLDREIEHHAALLLAEGIDSGAVRPFSSKLFEVDKVHQAISYKEAHPSDSVVLKLGESKPGPLEVEAVTRLLLAPHKVYVVLGGLGELGLQLAHWLVQRGARKLLLTADSGKETGYEQRKLREWKKMGVTVMVSERITGTQFCAVVLITDAKKLGPVGGIFDIKMGEDCYSRVKNLETVVRDTCRSINWFIVFRRDSQSTELLEWCEGKIDENYKVQVIKLVDHQQIGCPSPWRLPPNDLEAAMLQDCTECDLCLDAGGTQERKAKNETTLECLCRLSGVLDMSSLEGSLSLNQLGLDILDIAELKLHVDKLAWFTSQELKHMKVEELLDLLPESTDDKKSEEETENLSMADLTDSDNKKLRPLLPSFSDQQMIVKLNSWPQPAMPVYIIYNDETVWEVLELARMVKAPVYGLHVTADTPTMSVNALAGYFLQNLCLNNNCEPFILIGHKFGCPVAIEMTLQLDTDDLDLVKQLICLEGSQMYVMAGENDCVSSKGEYDKDEMEEMALISFLQSFDVTSEEALEVLENFDDDDDNISTLSKMAEVKQSPRLVSLGLTSPQVREVITRYVQQYMNVCTFRPTAGTVKAPVTLIRGRQNQKGSKMPGDYGLSKVYEGGVAVHILNTPHGTVLQKMADEVMATINATVEKAKTAG